MKTFLDIVADEYDSLKESFNTQIRSAGMVFDEDIYGETMIKCQEQIGSVEMRRDCAVAYFWKSFKTNTIREKKYSRNSQRCEDSGQDIPSYNDGGILLANIMAELRKKYGFQDIDNFLRHAEGESYGSIGDGFGKKKYHEINQYLRSII